MNHISFLDFNVTSGKIECLCKLKSASEEKSIPLHFYLTPSSIPSNDSIALALSTLCGRSYTSIYYDLSLTSYTITCIQKFTQSQVTSYAIQYGAPFPLAELTTSGLTLNFSGGIDSLSSLCLMPTNTKLVSMDFEEGYEREVNFFSSFHPYTVRTNLRLAHLNQNSWTYMGIASLLFHKDLRTAYNVFGTILEANAYHFHHSPRFSLPHTIDPFSFMGMKELGYVNALTEVGTTLVISHYSPHLFNDSLISCSNPRTEKRFRKQLLAELVCDKFNRQLTFDKSTPPSRPKKFGTSLALDFLALYELKHTSLSMIEHTLEEIPPEAIDLTNQLSLSFYERFNSKFLNQFPDTLQKEYVNKLLDAGLLPYDAKDWEEFNCIKKFLSQYHNNLDR